MPENTVTLDVLVYQPEFGEAKAEVGKLDEDTGELLHEFPVHPSELRSTILDAADDYVEEVPFMLVPPPGEPQGVYKIGEVTVNDDNEVVETDFSGSVKDHGHIGKDPLEGDAPSRAFSGP